MSFDKAKAMRNAERFVAQGKLSSAISEFRSVVENDPQDVTTMNMLGDLYAKNKETSAAISCYMQVAEHYKSRGFSQKAIAVYNKVAKLQPNSPEVTAKLAELHKIKGSLAEARSHYYALAKHLDTTGKKLEALSIYKQIALLDPNNPEVCLNLANSYAKENHRDEALEAFVDAAGRFSRQARHDEAVRALNRAFQISSTDPRVLNGLVDAYIALGQPSRAELLLEEVLENNPLDREVLNMLIDCCFASKNAASAERTINKLIEVEPANHPRFLDLMTLYLELGDVDAASRALSISMEYLLAAGRVDDCSKAISKILDRSPDHIPTLTLLAKFNAWIKDEAAMSRALERLRGAALAAGSVEHEHFALLHLVALRPGDDDLRERLSDLEEVLGEQTGSCRESLLIDSVLPNTPGDVAVEPDAQPAAKQNTDLSPADQQRLQRELESIEFYIENDYHELAERSLAELSSEFGSLPELAELGSRIGISVGAEAAENAGMASEPLGIDEIRHEFGIDGLDDLPDGDFETHYNTAIAYQEMGLTEQAIAEFQDAIAFTRPDDGTRRFFQCSNLLGHCFMEAGRANHAVMWFERACAVPGVSQSEFHGLWYQLALAHEANGEDEASLRYFEKIYAENVDFLDVAQRVGVSAAPA
jgi:tetratricopeptide (TPR) repeat protein